MKTERAYLRPIRYGVQFFFLLFTIYIGYRFYGFVLHFTEPGHPYIERPPSVEAFLPIGGLMALKYFIFTGIVDPVHPAGFVLFMAILSVSLLLKKGFCGWICPIGTISQYLWMSGEKVIGRNLKVERYTDIAFRSIKYLLMFLFLLLIGVAMAPNMMVLFFITDYYKAVDVRMMQFFTEMSTVSMAVVSIIAILSLLYKNVWCRYLCPYGALLGLLSAFSPLKVRRNKDNCINCGSCTRHCPSQIDVQNKETVLNPECFGCLTCLSRCPQKGALDISIRTKAKDHILKPYLFPIILIVVFYAAVGIGMATDNWRSKVPYEEYKRILPGLTNSESK